jgi:hypothetical protein
MGNTSRIIPANIVNIPIATLGNVTHYDPTFNPIDKLVELYERIINEKEEKIIDRPHHCAYRSVHGGSLLYIFQCVDVWVHGAKLHDKCLRRRRCIIVVIKSATPPTTTEWLHYNIIK